MPAVELPVRRMVWSSKMTYINQERDTLLESLPDGSCHMEQPALLCKILPKTLGKWMLSIRMSILRGESIRSFTSELGFRARKCAM